jgi:hypothetical protein
VITSALALILIWAFTGNVLRLEPHRLGARLGRVNLISGQGEVRADAIWAVTLGGVDSIRRVTIFGFS